MIRLLPLLLVACATLRNAEPEAETCGNVGPVLVQADKWNAFIHCPQARAITERAAAYLPSKLIEPWTVTFTYGFLQFSRPGDGSTHIDPLLGPGALPVGGEPVMAVDVLKPSTHTIRVHEQNAAWVLHALMHAWMLENGWEGTQHQAMCASKGWMEVETEFEGIRPDICRRGE